VSAADVGSADEREGIAESAKREPFFNTKTQWLKDAKGEDLTAKTQRTPRSMRRDLSIELSKMGI
jgi:hypothetical protein